MVCVDAVSTAGFLSIKRNLETPAIGNRGYTNDVHLRGRRRYSEMENYQIKSLTHGGGFGLCRRGFNRRVSLN
ncbi:hypothetical protein, partial [Microcoleus sp. CAWBG556]|uniref:hypothetical protein n=1 Tax=Microcoleus sp. CAWBG556 TaxID=2841650 RepID=UPI00260004A0